MGLQEAFAAVVILAPQKGALPEEWHFLEVELQWLDGVGSRGLILLPSHGLAEIPEAPASLGQPAQPLGFALPITKMQNRTGAILFLRAQAAARDVGFEVSFWWAENLNKGITYSQPNKKN